MDDSKTRRLIVLKRARCEACGMHVMRLGYDDRVETMACHCGKAVRFVEVPDDERNGDGT